MNVEGRYKPIWARDTHRKKDKVWEGVRKDFMEKEALRDKEFKLEENRRKAVQHGG